MSKCYLIIEEIFSGTWDDQICFAECWTGMGKDWKQILYKNSKEDMGERRHGCLEDHGAFQMLRHEFGIFISFLAIYSQLKPKSRCEWSKYIDIHMIHAFCTLHKDFKARWSTCPWLPKVGRKNYTQYLWNNTFSLSSLSKPCLKFKVIHKEETKFSNFLLFFFSHLGTYLFQKYPQISLFSQGNQYTQPREQ